MRFFNSEFTNIEALAPAADAAGRTGIYVSLKNITGAVFIVCHIAQGNAATVKLTPQQATAVAGTGAKPLTSDVPIWVNLDTAAGDLFTDAAAAKDYTTDAALKNKIVVFEIDPASLDTANGFNCITVTTGASNAANITQAMYSVGGARYAPPPSMIVD